VALGYAGAILTVAFSTASSEGNLRKPFGGYPGYLSLMESDFDRAGEDAWLVGVAYDFERLGLRGLSAFFNFARGTGARDPANGQALADEREYDLTVDYRVVRKGWLEGLWLRLRGAVLESGATPRRRSV
jgi:outer membrane porin, OprD family